MTNKTIMKSRLFILGAGFSASAGVPLTAQLLDLTMEKFSNECSGIFQRVNNYARESIECYDYDKILDYSEVDFSELCTFLEFVELREYGGGERWNSAGSREKLALKFYLSKTILEKTPVEAEIPQLYIDFANQLHERDIVLSFNWDGLLELALEKVGKEYTYNFESEKAIKLCKLHGSVNWRIDEYKRLNKKINTLGWQSLNFTDGMMDKEIYHSPQLLSFNTWNNYGPLGEVEPFLVLPGYGKAFDVRSNASLWYKPEFAFGLTHDVYIIGLSLAPDDFFIRSLFLSNLPYIQSESDEQARKVFIINPDQNAKDNYNFVLSKGASELLNENFDTKHIKLMEDRLKQVSY